MTMQKVELAFPSERARKNFEKDFNTDGIFIFQYATILDDGRVHAYYLKKKTKVLRKHN